MIKNLLRILAWKLDHISGNYGYYENSMTGERMAVKFGHNGHTPFDAVWISEGRNS